MSRPAPPRRAGRGTLIILALFLAASGALRLGDGVGAALAAAESEPAHAPETAEAATCPEPPAALAAALKDRAEAVRAKEAALEARLAALDLSEAAIARRLGELETAEADLRKVLAIADEAAEKDLQQLVAVYEAMKPADAARLFATMAPEFAAGFLSRMQPAAAAGVLAGMEPEKAYSITALIAGRNALAPKN